MRGERRPAGVAAAVPGGHRRRAVLLEEPAEGRAGLRAVGDGGLPECPVASAARHRRARRGRLGGADEHHRLPPVAVARRELRQPGPAAHRPRPAAGHRLRRRGPGRPRTADGAAPRSGLDAFIKTSGNRGLHVFAPIEPTREFQDVRHAVIAAARELERRMPEQVTTAWWKEERGERIFVDFNQANRDRTMAGAYSPRALPHAPVSTPLDWDELESADPKAFTIAHRAGAAARRSATRGRGSREHPGTHRRAARLVGARPGRGPRRAAVPARLPEDAGGAAAGAAQPGPQGGLRGLRRSRLVLGQPTIQGIDRRADDGIERARLLEQVGGAGHDLRSGAVARMVAACLFNSMTTGSLLAHDEQDRRRHLLGAHRRPGPRVRRGR